MTETPDEPALTPSSDRPAKLDRLAALLHRVGAETLALTSAESLAWLLDGARVTVPYGGAPVLAAVVDRRGGMRVVAYSNEAARLAAEELDVELATVPWFEPLLEVGDHVAESAVLAELRAARAALLPAERARYAAFGGELAAAVTDVARRLEPALTERQAASLLAGAVVGLGAEPVVILLAGSARLQHRHPLPTTGRLGDRAMLVVGARRHGLVANLTRWVAADPSSTPVEDALLEVEADAFAATHPGRALGDVLADIAAAYVRHGFREDEWTRHHQGGPTGYVGRDPRATPHGADRVQQPQAFAWNPTAPGAKVEDTVVIDEGRLDVLTADPAWPARVVRGVPRPLPLGYGAS